MLQCIQQKALWQQLTEFQKISDQNPDAKGHGNRDTGTPGYKASVDYVQSLMQNAGYAVSVQTYTYSVSEVIGDPQFGASDGNYPARDWFVARLSGAGTLTAAVQPSTNSGTGCSADEFVGFVPGNVALLQRGPCSFDTQIENAEHARASAVVLYNAPGENTQPTFQARLTRPATIPVIGMASSAIGVDLSQRYAAHSTPTVHLDVRTQRHSGQDYNLIADSPFGDPNHVVVVEGHLDSIFGAGILDNASGSATILEIALNMAKTPTRNQLRYIWFGGEEIGLLGSAYYTKNLTDGDRKRIAFDIDADVTATPNFDYLVADPAHASNVKRFPKNVVPQSKIGNQFFADFFTSSGVPSAPAWFGNDGTDSNSFSLIGIPNTGILTQQDCCKSKREVKIWGGALGNYEGNIPSRDGGCVDRPGRWCDNLSNNNPDVLELASKATAYVTFQLANYQFATHP